MTVLPASTTAPGSYVQVASAPPPGANAPATGAWFVAGMSQRGPVGVAIPLQSMADYATYLGTRQSYSAAYDALDAFFDEGGNQAYFSRAVGPAATAATISLNDQGTTAQPTLKVSANGPGIWGNNLAVAVIAGPTSGTFQIQAIYNGTVVETSPPLVTPADAANWGTFSTNPAQVTTTSKWFTITNLNSTNAAPKNQPALVAAPGTSLATGTDDNSNVTDTIYQTCLTAFLGALGPGQVSVPGITSNTTYENLLNHAYTYNRVALLDAANGATASTITTATSTVQAAVTDPSYGTVLAPWLFYPGIPTGTLTPAYPRQVPPCGPAAALMSRNDAANNAGVPAAGPNGVLASCLGAVQLFNDSDRATLNNAGVSVFRQLANGTALYGYESLSLDSRWTDLGNVRLRMQIQYNANQIGAQYDFNQIDGQGKLFSAFNGALVGYLTTLWQRGALYGPTAASAFQVNTGPAVNTAATIANRQICAELLVRMSPSAEFALISIVKYGAGQTLPA